jgi:hypothetical protein
MSIDDHRGEAERLAQLPREDQRQVIALHRSTADNPRAPKRDRDFARQRADALERHLKRLNRRKEKAE